MTATVYDLINERREFAQDFVLIPQRINGFQCETALNWASVPFQLESIKQVSNKPGIYAFIIRSDTANLPPHGYVMYVGIAKQRKRQSFLRQRFREYLREQDRADEPRRSHISDMLRRWRGLIYFYFATVEEDSNLLDKIEIDLNDAFQPPKSHGDLSATVRAAKRAFP
ncbi:MAG: GIY-YIG nuclease family protein [Geminicoccaceae bacterium]|nr:GIY-YIG nuclease family protein [Geminicoccaceae bacterium]